MEVTKRNPLEAEDVIDRIRLLSDTEVAMVMRAACSEYEARKSEGSEVRRANAYMQHRYGDQPSVL